MFIPAFLGWSFVVGGLSLPGILIAFAFIADPLGWRESVNFVDRT